MVLNHKNDNVQYFSYGVGIFENRIAEAILINIHDTCFQGDLKVIKAKPL